MAKALDIAKGLIGTHIPEEKRACMIETCIEEGKSLFVALGRNDGLNPFNLVNELQPTNIIVSNDPSIGFHQVSFNINCIPDQEVIISYTNENCLVIELEGSRDYIYHQKEKKIPAITREEIIYPTQLAAIGFLLSFTDPNSFFVNKPELRCNIIESIKILKRAEDKVLA